MRPEAPGRTPLIYLHLKQEVEWTPRTGRKLRAGESTTHYVLTPGYVTAAAIAPVNATTRRPPYALETTAYISHEWAATDQLDFALGLRASGFRLLGPGTCARTTRPAIP